MTHKTLGGATCPNQDVARRCPRCGWINPAVWRAGNTALSNRQTETEAGYEDHE